jgi:HEAT repeat protein
MGLTSLFRRTGVVAIAALLTMTAFAQTTPESIGYAAKVRIAVTGSGIQVHALSVRAGGDVIVVEGTVENGEAVRELTGRIKAVAGNATVDLERLVPAATPATFWRLRLKDPAVEVRLAAVREIGARRTRLTDASALLVAALGDTDDSVRRAAAETLARGADLAAVAELKKRIIDKDPQVRARAAVGLLRANGDAATALAVALPMIRHTNATEKIWGLHIAQEAGKAAAALRDAVLAQFAQKDATVRWQAAAALAAIGPDLKDFPKLVEMLEDSDADVRASIVRSIKSVGPAGKDALPALLSVLDTDGNALVRIEAVQAVEVHAVAGVASAVEGLHLALKTGDAAVRRAAVLAVGRMGPSAGPKLLGSVEVLARRDPDARVRGAALEVVARLSGDK